jgi:hypothetical protein
MKFAKATELNRKSGRAKWRDLLCACPPNKGLRVSSQAVPKQVVRRELVQAFPDLVAGTQSNHPRGCGGSFSLGCLG